VIVLAFVTVACTGGGTERPSSTPSTSCPPGECVVASDPGEVRYRPGEYSFAFNKVTATLSLQGSTATLQVQNGSGADLGEPGVYVLSGDDKRYDGIVESPATIADGDSGTFTVMFPEQVKPSTVGLVVLLFGGSNFGALKPVPET
jgi:hypothetical protein